MTPKRRPRLGILVEEVENDGQMDPERFQELCRNDGGNGGPARHRVLQTPYTYGYGLPRVIEEELRGDFSSVFDSARLEAVHFDSTDRERQGAIAWLILLRRKADR